MTENEIIKQAIRCIVGACDETCKGYDAKKSVCNGYGEVASGLETILKEYEQYRAIGTVEDLKTMKENGAFSGVELAQILAMQKELKKYQSIGTIDEFKALKEKNEPKKAMHNGANWYRCPNGCEVHKKAFEKDWYCPKCGVKLDWSE